MKTHCREYQQQDIKPLKKLVLELGYPLELSELVENISEIYKRGGIVLVAETDKQVVGSVCVVIDARLAEGVCGEIVSLIVGEGARGQGVGKSLIREAERWVEKRVKTIRVRANEIRRGAHAFYENQGYREVKTQKIFEKQLGQPFQ